MKKKYFTEEERKEANKKKCNKYRKKYYEEVRLREKNYYNKNKEQIKRKRKKYRLIHKEEKKLYDEKYRQCHKKEKRQYQNNRRKNDINYKLTCDLRSRLNKAITNNQKSGSAIRDLGCSIPELKVYLESKFREGMSWDNHGYRGWHIDHILPLASFDLSNREEFLKANHYTNLQPMWAEENLRKKDK